MNPADPKTLDELFARQKANTVISGYGMETGTLLPCPFCGAKGFMLFRVTEGMTGYREVQRPHVCSECKRVARLIIVQEGLSTSCEIVQCGGDEPAEWLQPRPRREESQFVHVEQIHKLQTGVETMQSRPFTRGEIVKRADGKGGTMVVCGLAGDFNASETPQQVPTGCVRCEWYVSEEEGRQTGIFEFDKVARA